MNNREEPKTKSLTEYVDELLKELERLQLSIIDEEEYE